MEGRRPDSEVVLRFRLGGERVEAARFEVVGDKSCRAALSLLTTWATGREWSEVVGVTPEVLGAVYGFDREFFPQLLPALEALQAAAASARGEPSPCANDGALVCLCLHVRRGRIERAIQERGLTSVEDVSFWTRAGTGCRSCRPELKEMVEGRPKGGKTGWFRRG